MADIILIDKLIPKMILNQDIYNEHNILMLSKGVALTQESIETIKFLGYSKVSILKEDASHEPVCWQRDDEEAFIDFRKKYEDSGRETAELIKFISDGNQLDIEEAYHIPRSILNDIKSPFNLMAYLNIIKQLDNHTFGHSLNVSLICGLICRWLKLQGKETKNIVVAGLLHDIGKTKISQMILQKPGPLTEEEREEIKRHTIYGYRILETAGSPPALRVGALFHHEREDGLGYPSGLNSSSIPLSAKVISIADVYDAMTSNRPYRGKICPFKVIAQFQHSFYGALDTGILLTFLNRIADCYMGEVVQLSDGRTGQIVVINPNTPSRPQVWTSDGIVNLKNEPDLEIDTLLPWMNFPCKRMV